MQNKPLIRQVVVILVHGLGLSLFKEKKELMPSLSGLGKPATINGPNAHANAGVNASDP